MDDTLFGMLADIRERIVGLESKFERMEDTDLKLAQAIVELDGLKARVTKIDSIIFWAGTTIIGAVIIALLALIFR